MDKTKSILVQLNNQSENNLKSHENNVKSSNENVILNNVNNKANEIKSLLDIVRRKLALLNRLIQDSSSYSNNESEINQKIGELKQSLNTIQNGILIIEESIKISKNCDTTAYIENIIKALRFELLENTKIFTKYLNEQKEIVEKIEMRRKLYGASSSRLLAADVDLLNENDNTLDNQAPTFMAKSALINRNIINSYEQTRNEAVEQIQSTIGEVATMIQKIASVVTHQEEMVMRIDATVDQSLVQLRKGQLELLRYLSSIANQRTLLLKVFGILALFALIFIPLFA